MAALRVHADHATKKYSGHRNLAATSLQTRDSVRSSGRTNVVVTSAVRGPEPASAYLRLMMNSLGAGFLCVDENYLVTDANSIALEWLGACREDVLGRPFAVIAPRSPMQMLRSAVERGIFVDRQLPSYGRPDRLLDLHVYPVESGAIIFFRDVTEQKQSTQANARAEALLRSLDVIATHVILLDRSGTVVGSNLAWQRFADLHGLNPADGRPLNYLALRSKPWAHRPEAKRIRAALSGVLDGSARTTQLDYIWRLDGAVRSFSLRAERYECDGERYLMVANEDISALKEAERCNGELCERLLALQEEERQRIAGELHDCTAQHLVALGLNLMRLKAKCGVAERADELFAEIETSLQEASKELRAFTYLLHPPHLIQDGLLATLEQYVDGFAKRTGLDVVLRTTPLSVSISTPLQRCMFRIVQEGLSNVHRHASATHVEVHLRCVADRLHLVVLDNGCGIEPTTAAPGVGLPGISARLNQFGGRLKVESSSRGTRLHAAMPLAAGAI